MSDIPQPDFITFTGIDDRTDLGRAHALAEQYPIEWGVLISANNRDARFPSQQTVDELMAIAGKKSAHLCGLFARQAVEGFLPDDLPVADFDRIQVNGVALDQTALFSLAQQLRRSIIVQVRGEGFGDGPLQELFDCSGGRGVLPDKVPAHPGGGRLVGFAGGMGPETVSNYLEAIGQAGPFWIDMEGRVRSRGWFDLDKVEAVCRQVFHR